LETEVIRAFGKRRAIAAALAVRHPEMVVGLVFLSPAVYPWPGGVAWYNQAARAPITGRLFSALIAPPLGLLAIDRAMKEAFAPNSPPPRYIEKVAGKNRDLKSNARVLEKWIAGVLRARSP
jgi:pimeloyl-ACP methyl ester carboxylesterase